MMVPDKDNVLVFPAEQQSERPTVLRIDPADIIMSPAVTSLNLNPDLVLNQATKDGLTDVIIIGYDNDGDEYFKSSISDGGTALWLLQRSIHRLMRLLDDVAGAGKNGVS
jgi:hypothetical protein